MINDLIVFLFLIVHVIFISRFHFEQSHVDAYLQPIRILRKLTEPLVMPMRQILPKGVLRMFAPIIVAWIVTILMLLSIGIGTDGLNLNTLLADIKFSIVLLVVNWTKIITYAVVAYVIMSWIPHPKLRFYYYLLHEFLSVVLSPIKRLVPAFGGIDLSPMILLFIVYTLSNFIRDLLL